MNFSFLKNKRFLFIVGLYLLLNVFVNILHPITTVYVRELELDSAFFGFFYSAMSLGQVVGSLLWGFLSDKKGRKPWMILGTIGYALSQLGFGFLNRYAIVIVLFRLLSGFFASAPITLFLSAVIDESETSSRTESLSFAAGIALLGASIGYEVGGLLHTYGGLEIPTLFLVQSGFGLVLALLLFFFLPETRKAIAEQTIEEKPKEKKAVRLPIIVFLAFLLCLTVGQVNLSKYTDTLVIDRGYSTATLGHYVFITGLLGFFANLFLIPVLKKAKNLRHERLLLLFVFVSAILILITYNVPGDLLVMLYTSNLAYAMIKTMITPLEQAHLAKNTNDSNRGTVMGLRQSVISIGNVIGPLVGSAVYVTGSATIMNVSAGFLGVGFLILILDLFLERKAQKI